MSNDRYTIPNAYTTHESLSNLDFQFSAPAEQSTPDKTDGLDARLLYITSSRYDGDWNSIMHTHAFSELFFVTKGYGRFHYDGNSTSLRANDLIIINPYVEHTEFSQEDDPLEYIVLGIEGLRFSPSTQEEASHSVYRLKNSPTIGSYIKQLLSEAQEQALGYESVCKHLLDIVLTLILRQEELHIAITPSSYIHPFCVQIKDYMDAHFKETLDLDSLAKIAKQNKYYLAHAFSQSYGISPMRYLMKRRIDESMLLLSETSMPIYDIGDIVGFSSPSHFAQAFKRMTGYSPNAYRKSVRK